MDHAAGADHEPDHQQHQASSVALPLGRSPAESAEQHPEEGNVGESEMATDSTTRPHALEHGSSGAKRPADRDWSDSGSPMKRQELEQQPTSAFGPAAVATAGSDTAMTQAFGSNTASAAADVSSADGTADSDAVMTHALASHMASAADDKAGDDKAVDSDAVTTHAFGSNTTSAAADDTPADGAADSDDVTSHALASDIASAADDKAADGAVDSDTIMTHALALEMASAADDKGKAADSDSAVFEAAPQEDTSAAGTYFMTHAEEYSDADLADRVMLDLDDEMEGLISSAEDTSESKRGETRDSIEEGIGVCLCPPPPPPCLVIC